MLLFRLYRTLGWQREPTDAEAVLFENMLQELFNESTLEADRKAAAKGAAETMAVAATERSLLSDLAALSISSEEKDD